MAKIIKHTFNIPNLSVKNGELVEGEPRKETYTFTLLYRGVGLFEEITGKSLFATLVACASDNEADSVEKFLNKDLIKTLACVSYVKIAGDKFHNNRATVEEFKKTPVYPLLEQDIDFVSKLFNMAMECVYEEEKSKKQTQGAVKPPKK